MLLLLSLLSLWLLFLVVVGGDGVAAINGFVVACAFEGHSYPAPYRRLHLDRSAFQLFAGVGKDKDGRLTLSQWSRKGHQRTDKTNRREALRPLSR